LIPVYDFSVAKLLLVAVGNRYCTEFYHSLAFPWTQCSLLEDSTLVMI